MDSKPTKLYSHGKTETIMYLVTLILVWLGTVSMMALGYKYIGVAILGGFFCLMFTSAILYILLGSFFVEITSGSITEKNAFGKIKKVLRFDELKEITKKHAFRRGDYLCLNFSEKDFTNYTANDLFREDEVILILFSKKTVEILKRYTDIPITDTRK